MYKPSSFIHNFTINENYKFYIFVISDSPGDSHSITSQNLNIVGQVLNRSSFFIPLGIQV